MSQDNPESVRATLSFVVDTGEKPINYPSEAGGREEHDVGVENLQEVEIHNARRVSPSFDVEQHGFALVRQEEPGIDFYDDDLIENIYKPSVASLLKDKLGARRVFVFDHTRRSDSGDLREERRIRGPAALVHNDYTSSSGIQRLKDFLPEEVSEDHNGRIQIINFWRSMDGPVQRSPLAMCDARTLVDKDAIATERRARDRIGEITRFAYNPDYRWYYYPNLAPNEAILIRTFDSASEKPMRVAPHCAFEDPTTPESAPPRCSIEVRAFVLH